MCVCIKVAQIMTLVHIYKNIYKVLFFLNIFEKMFCQFQQPVSADELI